MLVCGQTFAIHAGDAQVTGNPIEQAGNAWVTGTEIKQAGDAQVMGTPIKQAADAVCTIRQVQTHVISEADRQRLAESQHGGYHCCLQRKPTRACADQISI